jgi:hypothetical protein
VPRSVEIDYFSQQLAALIVTAARAQTEQQLVAVHDALVEMFHDAFTLLWHDALGGAGVFTDLLGRLPIHSEVHA